MTDERWAEIIDGDRAYWGAEVFSLIQEVAGLEERFFQEVDDE